REIERTRLDQRGHGRVTVADERELHLAKANADAHRLLGERHLVDLDRGRRADGRAHGIDDSAESKSGRYARNLDVLRRLRSPELAGEPAERGDRNTEAKAGRVHRGPDDLIGVLPDVTNCRLKHGARVEHWRRFSLSPPAWPRSR